MIEYAGRIDHQVKLRGLRIELGEIEARLLEHDLVREAVVTVPDGKQLVGYVVLAGEAADWQAQLAEHLRRGLPDYMVPNQWLALDSLPLSPNGKLDRKALPRPDQTAKARDYQAPATPTEIALAEIWQAVLAQAQWALPRTSSPWVATRSCRSRWSAVRDRPGSISRRRHCSSTKPCSAWRPWPSSGRRWYRVSTRAR